MRVVLFIFALAALATSCKPQHEPCSGMSFEPVTLPMSFGVTKKGKLLGRVTMDAQQTATFEPDASADKEALDRFQADFDALTAADAASYKYGDHDGESTHFSCGGSTAKGTPQYPAAFKYAIYSEYYEVTED